MSIKDNIKKIKSEIGDAKLIAVSKKQPIEKLHEALEAGHRIFGENYVQEAAEKFADLREKYNDVELHLIGPLQTNKVKEALQIFDVIQTIDREKLAKKIASELNNDARTKEFMVQVNIGEEEQKSGIAPQDAEEFTKYCINGLGLNITGLMCIPPADEQAGMYFALLRNIAQKLARTTREEAKLPRASALSAKSHAALELMKLSMGMSADYLEAIEMGADYVRIGTGVFGERQY